jgi:hypothetical protein
MKTKTFLLSCLLLSIGLTKLSAQDLPDPYAHNKHGTGATITTGGTEYPVWVPVICDGAFVDFLSIDYTLHYLDHWKDGNWISYVISVKGEAKSETGETFEFNEQIKEDGFTSPPFIISWKINLRGNKGSHYIMSLAYDWTNDISYLNKTMCF